MRRIWIGALGAVILGIAMIVRDATTLGISLWTYAGGALAVLGLIGLGAWASTLLIAGMAAAPVEKKDKTR